MKSAGDVTMFAGGWLVGVGTVHGSAAPILIGLGVYIMGVFIGHLAKVT